MPSDNRLSALTQGASNRALLEQTQPQMLTANESFLSEQKDLRSYVAQVYRRKWMIVSIVLIVTTLVTVYMYRLPSLYQAETTVRIEQ
ncbi:MAG TPA: Wzz/FepE/Etk N-terminal domain-containing protein [Pyrinomonadaceae bacterium]|nr:Wzz/FepE/Etk N-terminal domain-containing protein [Pyrinomonadaceae bacterium]